jgi:NAD(P)-dependent dehydrogenase (short-subunit alcohol dehydrogenase family)
MAAGCRSTAADAVGLFDGLRALVTGGNAGIARYNAGTRVRLGANVTVAERTQGALDEAVEAIRAAGGAGRR